ncbi:hypothetical protein BP5796_10922 [Coleophoma crateriformis]|uniref:Arrestin-like N-terminal domain-containing protein n=1 Tax=Coleophoma crateriformis TaxID=565419 RepID=A0A3D8QLU5_9HELO|nr:hypothetical protein BP5796_10922 [Coleophoma crateriformis]
MSVRVHLDNPHTYYTNLEFISGKIILHLTKDENVSAIIVKLEGESKTVLMRPSLYQQNPSLYAGGRQTQRQQLAHENHKILYKSQQVFPTPDPVTGSYLGLSYTLRPGSHEYPFRFKIPFNNGCWDPQAQREGPGAGGFGNLGLGSLQQLQYSHAKKTLPPSLTGFPGEAEIRYYVKVTVQRPSLFKENRRSAIGFKFLPVEPPRPPTTSEAFARRPHSFQAGMAGYAKKSSMFKKKAAPLSDTAPQIEVEARLPSPAILTCNQPLPLRIIGRRKNESPELAFITSLSIHLFGFTVVRALDVTRTEPNDWVLMSLNGLSIPITAAGDKIGTEVIVEDKYWNQIRLPNTVAPSFQTCNITRHYEVEVRVGLGYGPAGDIQPQSVVLPLRFPVEIFSGISPPAALLTAMAARPTQNIPVTGPSSTPASDPAYPPQLSANGPAAEDLPPPSYEDAMAEEFTQPNGPRPEYSGVTNENAPSEVGEKGGPPPPSGGDKNGPPGYSGHTVV